MLLRSVFLRNGCFNDLAMLSCAMKTTIGTGEYGAKGEKWWSHDMPTDHVTYLCLSSPEGYT